MRERVAWRKRLVELIRHDRFLRRVALLSGGTILGHAVTLAVSPILTRLYSPAEFGLFGVFVALCGLPSGIMTLRYEFAIPVCRSDAEAVRVTAAALLVSLGLACVIALAVGLVPASWLDRLDTPGLAAALWLLPLSLLFWGWSLTLSYWSVRRGTFRANALGKVLQMVSQGVAQLGAGLAGAGGLGLVVGYTLGQFVRCAHFFRHLDRTDWRLLRQVDLAMISRSLREHWRYPVFSSPSALLHNTAQFLPALLLASFYGPAVAGWFTLAQRLLEMPVGLLSASASAAYVGELRDLDSAGIRRLFVATAGRFLVLGLVGMLPLLLVAPPLFAFIFGEEWRTSGVMVQCLVPVQLARFVVMPITQTMNVYHRQALHLVAAAIDLGALIVSFGASRLAGLDPVATVLLFSLGGCVAYFSYLVMAWQVIRQATARGLAPHTGSSAGD